MKKLIAMLLAATLAVSQAYAGENRYPGHNYRDVINKTASMVSDHYAREIAQRYGLTILDLTWEDTGRYKNSSVGPNISDMTIQVRNTDPRAGYDDFTCMPVIRFPNFSDRTGDVALDKFYLLVGNEKGRDLKKVTLQEFLANMRRYMNEPSSWEGSERSLLAPRDTHALVSAQACFLPIPQEGSAEFTPVLFNYQSYEDDPAVLTILATREGTSVTVIDNKRDRFHANSAWGQQLFFNQNGERSMLTGQRMTDFMENDENSAAYRNNPQTREGLNMVLLIQVPLKQKKPIRYSEYAYDFAGGSYKTMASAPAACLERASDVENAVIGHGEAEGRYTEIDGLKIERDPAYPIRATVQFYKATSNGIVSENDMRQISEQIENVYSKADYVGSLVTGGYTGRPTEYCGNKKEPCNWWQQFWRRHNCNMHCSHGHHYDEYTGRYIGTKPAQKWGILE